jgi:AcrR family transcriptional regulator
VTAVQDRPLRADAARNAERILRAAREVYGELGPDAPMDVIARRAGVGERTLYRRFPTKGELARAVIDQSIAETLAPVIERATSNRNPLRGLTDLIEAAIALGAREHNVLAAALKAGTLTDVSVQLDTALEDLTCRAQEAGLVRADVVAEDLPRIIAMLNGVLSTMDPSSDGWRRYVFLMIDAMSTPTPRTLPRAVAIQYQLRPDDWPR